LSQAPVSVDEVAILVHALASSKGSRNSLVHNIGTAPLYSLCAA